VNAAHMTFMTFLSLLLDLSARVSKFDGNIKIDPSDPVKFCKIRYNSVEFRLEEVLYSKTPKNQKSAEFTD
jgi:hypothetical protein